MPSPPNNSPLHPIDDRSTDNKHTLTVHDNHTPSNPKAYVAKITEAFHAGLLPLQVGTTLRSYLSDKLNWCVVWILKQGRSV
jgi:hypothetical protein